KYPTHVGLGLFDHYRLILVGGTRLLRAGCVPGNPPFKRVNSRSRYTIYVVSPISERRGIGHFPKRLAKNLMRLSVVGSSFLRPFSSDASAWPESIIFGQHRILPSYPESIPVNSVELT